jgi:hypothetical protein
LFIKSIYKFFGIKFYTCGICGNKMRRRSVAPNTITYECYKHNKKHNCVYWTNPSSGEIEFKEYYTDIYWIGDYDEYFLVGSNDHNKYHPTYDSEDYKIPRFELLNLPESIIEEKIKKLVEVFALFS